MQAKEEKNDKENLDNDYDIKMSNGKKETKEIIYNNGFISREIIVKDVSTRDGRINVFIKYIDDFSFNQKIHNLSIKYNKKKVSNIKKEADKEANLEKALIIKPEKEK